MNDSLPPSVSIRRACLVALLATPLYGQPELPSNDPRAVDPAPVQAVSPSPAPAEPQVYPSAAIETHEAKTLEPNVFATTATTPLDIAAPLAAGAPTTSTRIENPVEPLSNGLRLSMTQREILAQFGEPSSHTFDARSFGYASFDVACGGAEAKIWHLTLKSGVQLSSGIGVGSTRADVERVFGPATTANVGQYRLTFSYTGDRVDRIKIDPADGEFAADKSDTPAAGSAAPVSTAKNKSAAKTKLVGNWYGVGDAKGEIELRADGTYAWAGTEAGRYSAKGDTLVFTAGLAAWNHGIAKLNARRDTFEFQWTTADGAKRWFAFAR